MIFRAPNHERLRAALKPAAPLFQADAFSRAEKALLSYLRRCLRVQPGSGERNR
jgi:hypothetical protein